MARGGPRQGAPGAQYANRTDLQAAPRQAPHAAPGQTYGEAKQQEDAQKAIPLPKVTPLGAPSERPNEPITEGLPTGPGRGPEALSMAAPADEIGAQLRAVFQLFPSEGIRQLIEMYDEGG